MRPSGFYRGQSDQEAFPALLGQMWFYTSRVALMTAVILPLGRHWIKELEEQRIPRTSTFPLNDFS
jgi:hypothetical protein